MNTIVFNNQPAFLRRVGQAGFLFFLVKGILWLIAPFVFAWLI